MATGQFWKALCAVSNFSIQIQLTKSCESPHLIHLFSVHGRVTVSYHASLGPHIFHLILILAVSSCIKLNVLDGLPHHQQYVNSFIL